METFQEFIDKFSSKRSSNTWKHRPAKSWDILNSRGSPASWVPKIKALYPPKIVTLKLSPVSEAHKIETYPFPELRHSKAESFSNWDLHKLKQFKGLKIHPYWMLRRRTQEFFQFWRFKQWFCSFPNVETLYKLKSSPMKSFSKVNKFGRLKMHTCPKLSYAVSFQNQRKTSEHVTVYTCHYLSKSETSETNFSSSLFLNAWCS